MNPEKGRKKREREREERKGKRTVGSSLSPRPPSMAQCVDCQCQGSMCCMDMFLVTMLAVALQRHEKGRN